MKVICTFSGGKDSLASLLWTRENISENITAVYCDTGFESQTTYDYLERIDKALGLNLVIIKNKKYGGLVDLSKHKQRFPSTMARFCTEHLKVRPQIDYILDEVQDDFLLIQGIRAAESTKRAAMSKQCTFFKYYFEPFKIDDDGRERTHSYRKMEVKQFREQFADDILRPVFTWSADEVVSYITERGVELNPLYKQGFKRVGCFPCIMASRDDLKAITEYYPDRIQDIVEYEKEIGSTFFPPKKIPRYAFKGVAPSFMEVIDYVKAKNATGDLFKDPDEGISCSSFYHLCE